MRGIWIGWVVVAACGGSKAATPDAAPAAPDAHVPHAVVYLDFEGVTLEPGNDDASTNKTTLVAAETIAPPYLAGVATRQTTIDAIVAATKTRLAPYDVDVVTDRPATAGYTMIVVTKDSSLLMGQSAGISAVAPFQCTAADPQGIALLFQSSAAADVYGPEFKANLVIAILGFEYLVPPTNQANDCMCWVGTKCGQNEAACVVGAAGTPVDTANDSCAGLPATIDEAALFTAALGSHP